MTYTPYPQRLDSQIRELTEISRDEALGDGVSGRILQCAFELHLIKVEILTGQPAAEVI